MHYATALDKNYYGFEGGNNDDGIRNGESRSYFVSLSRYTMPQLWIGSSSAPSCTAWPPF